MRIKTQPPTWATKYVGIPFIDRGRTSLGADCWGLLCMVYANEFGIHLPTLSHVACGNAEQHAGVLEQSLQHDWAVVDGITNARVGDVLRYEVLGRVHVAMLMSSTHMLHTTENVGSSLERMDSKLWSSRLRGVHAFAGPVRVLHAHSPMHAPSTELVMQAGGSVYELIKAAGVVVTPGLRAFVGDREIPAHRWHLVRPRAGRVLRLTCVPAGGGEGSGKSPLRTVLSIALIAGSIAAPYAIGLAGTLGGALFSAGVGLVGSLALNALVPAPGSGISDGAGATTSPSITGARNELRKFVPVPRVLGTHRVVPSYGALPYTERVDGDEYLRLLFLVGYGPLDVSDLRIGETPLDEFDGVEVQVRAGGDDDGPLSLYPATIIEDAMSVRLQAAASWQLRTTAIDADEVSVDLTWPGGLTQVDRAGNRSERTVAVELQHAPAGTQAWTNVNITSPDNERSMDYLFRTPEVSLRSTGTHVGRIAFGALFPDAKPEYLPASNYSYEVEGYVLIPRSPGGRTPVEFAVDGSDACDVAINGRTVVSFLGTHPTIGGATPSGDRRSTVVFYGQGWHRIRVRVEARAGNTGAVALLWRINGVDPTPFQIVPASSLSLRASSAASDIGKLRYRWFDTSAYAGSLIVTANTTESIKRTMSFAVARGQYDVRVRRITPDTDEDTIVDEVFLTAIRTIRNVDPVVMQGVCKIALRIKATGQLNGIIDNFNCLVTSILRDWDFPTQEWVLRATNNPASCMRAVLQSAGIKRPLPDSKINLADFQAFHDECRELGFACNMVIDTKGTVWERLKSVAATGRARVARPGGQVSPVREKRHTVPLQVFTPRNSSNFQGRKAFADVPHALRVSYINAERGYERDERVVYNDGFTIANATRFDTLELLGVTDPEQIYRLGRYYLAAMILRPEVFTLNVSLEYLACGVGDMVFITHDVPLWGLNSARVVDQILDSGGNAIGLRVDEEITMDAGDQYGITVRMNTGEIFRRGVQTQEGVTSDLLFTSPIAAADAPVKGDLLAFGRVATEVRQCIVQSIDARDGLTALLTLVDDAPAVLTADSEDIPDYNPGISNPPSYQNRPENPIIENIRSDDWVLTRGPDGSLLPQIVITFRTVSSTRPRATLMQVRIRPIPAPGVPGQGPWRTITVAIENSQIALGDVLEGVTYQIQLRGVTAIGQTSDWVEAEHTVVGKALPPPDVLDFDVQRLADGVRRYTWELGAIPPDVVGVQIRFGPSPGPLEWDSLRPLHDGTLEGASPTDLMQPAASGRYYFAIKMVDSVGNLSTNARTIERTLGAGSRDGVALSVDARALGFPGLKTGCYRTLAGDLEAIGEETWDDLDSTSALTWDGWSAWALRPANPIQYEHPAIDAGFVLDFSPTYEATFFGDIVVEYKYSVDNVTWTPYERIETFAGRSIRARYMQYKVSVFVRDGFPVPSLTGLVFLLRAEMISQIVNDLDTATLTAANRIAVGDIRLPITGSQFGVINAVRVTFNGTGAGYTWEVVDKDTIVGPRVRIYGPDDLPADALIDAEVLGVRGLTLS